MWEKCVLTAQNRKDVIECYILFVYNGIVKECLKRGALLLCSFVGLHFLSFLRGGRGFLPLSSAAMRPEALWYSEDTAQTR